MSFSTWARKKKATESADGWAKASISLVNDVQRKYTNWVDESERESYSSQITSLLSQASEWRKQYAGNKEAISYIDSVTSSLSGLSDYVNQNNNHYSQWSTADEYKSSVKRWEEYQSKWGHYADADDFDEYSAKGAAIKNPTFEDAEDDGRFLWWTWGGEEVGNIVTFSRENADMLAMAHGNGSSTQGNYAYRSMTDEEVNIYNYLLGKGLKDEAASFLSELEEELNAREGGARAGRITSIDIPVIEDLAVLGHGGLAGLDQWASGTRQFFTNEEQPTSVTQYANAYIGESLDGFASYAHQAATSIGNMAPSILASYVLGGFDIPAKLAQAGGAAVMGVSAAGNAYKDALSKGYDKGGARAYSTLVGAAEGGLQYLIGGISNLGGMSGKLAGKIAMIDNSLLRVGAKFATSIGSEIFEEELQNYLEPAFRMILTGEYDAPTVDELIETAIVTALSTGTLEGGGIVGSDIAETSRNYATGSAVMQAEGGVEGLQNLAKSVAAVSDSKTQTSINKRAESVSSETATGKGLGKVVAGMKNASNATKVGKLYDTVQNANNLANASANKADIAKSLERKGFDAKDANTIAEALVASYNGQELTAKQEKLLKSVKNNKDVQDAVSNIVENEKSTMGQRSQNIRDFQDDVKSGIVAKVFKDVLAKNSATYTPLEKRAGKLYSTSETGKATVHSTGDEIDLKKVEIVDFVRDKSGKITDMALEADGKKVMASDIDFESDSQSYLFSAIRNIENITPGDASIFVRGYDPASGQTVGEYLNGIDEAYTYGYHRYSEADMGAGLFTKKLTSEQAKGAYHLGKTTRNRSDTSKANAFKLMRTAAEAEAEKAAKSGKGASKPKEMTITYNNNGKVVDFNKAGIKLTDKQAAGVEMAKVLHKLGLGTNFEFFSSHESKKLKDKDGNPARVFVDENGRVQAAYSGLYRKSDGTIRIDLNAYNGKELTLNALAHELTHFIQQWSDSKYKVLVDFLMEAYEKTDMTMNQRVLREQARLKKIRGEDVSYNEAFDEVVANAMMKMFDDGKLVERLTALKAKDADLAHKLWEGFKDILKKFFGIYQKESALFYDTYDLTQMKEAFEQLQDMFASALMEASENFQASLTPGVESTVISEDGDLVAHSTEDGSVQLSMHTYDTEGRDLFRDYLNKCVSSKKLTKAEMIEMLDGIEEIYQTCKEFKDKYAPFSAWSDAAVVRDTHGRPVFSVVTPNGDYKMNLDFSLVCKKRRTLDAVFNEMSKRGIIDDFELGQKSVVKINEIIRKHGFETACALCFVDAKRFRQASMADSFTRLYNELVESLVPEDQKKSISYFNFSGYETIKDVDNGIDTWDNSKLDFSHIDHVLKTYESGTVEYKAAKYIKTHAEGRKLLLRGDFMSSKGFDAVKSQNPDVLKLYNSKKGTGGPKAAFGDVQYLNEIIKKARYWTPAKAYSVGGVRVQSFSDYVPRMVFDYVQMIYDLAATKLPAHAYTKEALFVKQFGLTGIKINMSLIPAIAEGGIAPGLDADGNYVWAGESFDYDTAKEIQNAEGYTENCGTICVGVSYDHIVKLLRDPNIRMVIPYHKSGLNPIVAHMNKIAEFHDYTNDQRTKGKDGKALDKDFDFSKALHDMGENANPKAVADQYLKWCLANGYTPRFAEFAMEDNYYKLLEDFTLYDKDGNYVPQREVRAVFPTNDSAFGSMKSLIETGLQEDAVIEGKRDKNLSAIVDEIQNTLPKTEAEIEETQVEQADRDLEADVQRSSHETDIDTIAKADYDGVEKEPVYVLHKPGQDVADFDHNLWDEKKAEAKQAYRLDDNESDGVNNYVYGKAYEWNAILRGDPNFERTEFVDFWIEQTINGLSKFPRFEGRTYRNLSFTNKDGFDLFLSKHRTGMDVDVDYFASSSKDPNGYVVDGDFIVHMVIDGFGGRDISDSYAIPGQQEVIYLPGTKIRITTVRTANDGHTLIYAQEVKENGKNLEANYGGNRQSTSGTNTEGQAGNVEGERHDLGRVHSNRGVEGNSDSRNAKIQRSWDYSEELKSSHETDRDVAYHAGDLGKAEGYWNMMSSNRGTGHFGTGTYFVGDEAKIGDDHYGKRPHEKVDFSNYNLFKPMFEEDGFKLHSALKYINDNIFDYPIAKMSFDEKWDVRKKADDAEYTLWDDDATDAEKADAQKVLDGFKEQFKSVGYDPDKMDAQELYEALKDVSSEYRATRSQLGMILGRNFRGLDYDAMGAKIDSIMQGIYDEVSQIEDAYAAKYEDSPSTRFMKALGYEGIDVRGFKNLDNTTYGSVIYDLKGDDLARKNEIGTARYSTHETDNISNRDLLANAFESITNGSEEYKLIQRYKSYIAELNSLENKLSKLNRQIYEMRFTEGKYDAEKLKKLEGEAKEIADKINKYDQYLLSLEASEPLRKVIVRERKKEAQKTMAHVKEIQQNKKDRAEQTELRHKIRKAVRDLDKLLNRGNKKLNVKEDMKGFASKALELADYIFTDHISNDELIRKGITVRMERWEAALVKETEDILSKLYDQAESLTDEEFTRLDAKRKANEDKLRELLKDQRNERLKTPVYNLFNDLVKEYASLKNSKQDSVKAAYDEELENSLRAFISDDEKVKILENMRVADMTTEELNWLYRAYTMALTNVRNANKFHVKGMTESIDQKAGRIASDFGSRKIPEKTLAIAVRNLSNKMGWNYEKLYYALERIGSDAFTELIMNVANSENIVMQDVIEAAIFRDQMVEKYGFNDWDVNKKIDKEFLDNTGKKFKLTLGELMSLYAYSRREGAWDHIEYGGFVFGEKSLTNPKPADSYKLSKEQCEAITNTLTEAQKNYAKDMQKFLSETMGGKGNEVSMMLYGVKMFGEKNYFPIHIAGQYHAKANESKAKAEANFSSMSNAGFTHAQNPNAKAPFVLEGFNEIWADHVNEMSRYHGTVPALEDLRRVMNRSAYSDSTTDSTAIKVLMENSFGEDAVKYFDNLYREANSGAISDKLEAKPKKLLSLLRKNSVAYSASVLVQQPASYVRAYALINPKYFGFKGFVPITSGVAKVITNKWTKAHTNAYNEMLKYAPGVTMAKEIGGFDTATGGSIRSYLLDTNKSIKQKMKTENALGKGKAVLDIVDDNAIANLPNLADKIAWIEIWNACKRETVAKHKDLATNSDEFMNIVGERFTEVIRATQVYDSIFAKSPMLKSKRLAVQYLVSFMNEPNTVANMAENAVREISRGNWKMGARTAGAVISSIVFTNVLKSIIHALRDDDEDETYIEKYIEAVSGNMFNDLVVFNYVPIAKDIWSVFQGYDVERADMAIVSDAIDALNGVIKNANTDTSDMTEEELLEYEKKVTEASWKLAESLAAFIGIPAKNIRREIDAVLDHARIASSNAGLTTSSSAWDKVYDAVADSIPFMSGNSKSDKLYDAIISGDSTYVDRMKSTYSTDNAYTNAVRKALRENDTRIREAAVAWNANDLNKYMSIAKSIIAEKHFTQDDIVSAIRSEASSLVDDGNATSTSKAKGLFTAEKFATAIASGDQSTADAAMEDIIETAMTNGKTREEAEKSFRSSAKSALRDMFVAGEISEDQAISAIKIYCQDEADPMDENDFYWLLREWNYEKENGSADDYGKYNDFYGAVLSGNNLRAVINEYTAHGVEKKTLASQITSYFKPLYKTMSSAERASLKSYLLNAYVALGYNRSEKSKDINNWLKD